MQQYQASPYGAQAAYGQYGQMGGYAAPAMGGYTGAAPAMGGMYTSGAYPGQMAMPAQYGAMPQASYGQHMAGYALPQASYGQPTAGYAMPQASYGQPTAGYAMPQQSYAMPQASYGQYGQMGMPAASPYGAAYGQAPAMSGMHTSGAYPGY